jgi:C-terminal processing protease CtpA/Prc
LAGVGIEIARTDDGRIMASDVEANAPAAKGGVQPCDIFVEVNGVKFNNPDDTPDDVAVNLRGLVGQRHYGTKWQDSRLHFDARAHQDYICQELRNES